jgi:hypothetical protein
MITSYGILVHRPNAPTIRLADGRDAGGAVWSYNRAVMETLATERDAATVDGVTHEVIAL